MHIINGMKFDENSSETLYSAGDGQSMTRENGRLSVYRSPKGTVWATLSYWVSETHDVLETAAGEADVRRLCARARDVRAVEAAFGPMAEG